MQFCTVKRWHLPLVNTILLLLICSAPGLLSGQNPRYVIADQDTLGPGGSDMASLLVLLQSPAIHLLGITVVSGDGWRDAEVLHALRLLELMNRSDVGVYPGAVFPLVRTQEWTQLSNQLYGKVTFTGAFNETRNGKWNSEPNLPEGKPTLKPADEDAAHFMVRMVHKYPHRVTIYAAGPLTNIALAIRLDPSFAELAQEIVMMGGSITPHTDAKEWVNRPRHEFNFWFDPEAASIVLNANWAKLTTTTIDASIQTHLVEVLDSLRSSSSPVAQYLTRYTPHNTVSGYAWDELAAVAIFDPSVIRGERYVYRDVDIDHGATYGDVLTWSDNDKPLLAHQQIHAQMDVDVQRLNKDLVELFTASPQKVAPPTP